jgi:hypothetical protein
MARDERDNHVDSFLSTRLNDPPESGMGEDLMEDECTGSSIRKPCRRLGIDIEECEVRLIERRGARERNVELQGSEIREPDKRLSTIGNDVCTARPVVSATITAVSTQLGVPSGKSFSKNRLPRMPSGYRLRVSGRSARKGSIRGAALRYYSATPAFVTSIAGYVSFPG